jgi:hypothetical protein
VVGASGGEDGFALSWGKNGHISGFRVSPLQSSYLPSGELPDDASMAAWINDRISEGDELVG